MTVEAETVVENQTLDITKVEEPFKTDKEVIADEEAEEKKDEEKEEVTEEVTEEKKKAGTLSRLRGMFDTKKVEKEAKEEVTEDKAEATEVKAETEEKTDEESPKKPVVNKKDFEEDVVYLFQFNRSSQIPSISPLCLQVESFLKLHGIKFENVDLKSKLWSKEGKMLPFIELNGEKIVGSNIFETLSKKFEKEIDAKLTEDQKKVQEEMTELVEKHLYWALVHWRSVDHENLLKGYKMVVPTTLGAQLPPAATKVYFNYTYCKRGLKQVKTSEFGTNTAEEIEQFGKDDLKKLSEKLGEQKLFFGDEVSSLDLVVFSYVAQIAMVEKEQPCAMREFLETDCKNLLELIEAVKEKVWGEDWEKATGEKIEMNPHIEVPVVEVEEEKVEEKEEEDKVEEKKEEEGEEEKVEDKEIKKNRGGTLSKIRGAFDMKKFAKSEKVEDGENKEETENKEVEAESEKKEGTEDKEDITDITEEKTEEKKKAGTLSRLRGMFDMKKVEKEEKEAKEEEATGVEAEATDDKAEATDDKAEATEDKAEEKTDEESPKKESTLTRMLSIFKKNKPVVVKKTTEDEEELEEEKETSEEKETKEESSAEAKEIVTDIVNEIADVKDLKTEAPKDLSKETEEL